MDIEEIIKKEMVNDIQAQIAPIYRKYPRYIFLIAIDLLLKDMLKPAKFKITDKNTLKKKAHMKKVATAKVKKVMKEFQEGKLHSGSKKGPEVHDKKQAIAIGLSEARKAGAKIPKKKGK